jgi:uncharacterized protein YceH (UPF0502 family)
MQENQVFEAVESLRGKNLVVRVDTPGQRVNKYRHSAREGLRVRATEIAILAELLVRGPQTLGELRGRASRMTPMDSLEIVKETLNSLMSRDEPMVRQLPPSPGSRAERYVQLLCPDLHPLDASASQDSPVATASAGAPSLSQRVETLEGEVTRLKEIVTRLAVALGEPSP